MFRLSQNYVLYEYVSIQGVATWSYMMLIQCFIRWWSVEVKITMKQHASDTMIVDVGLLFGAMVAYVLANGDAKYRSLLWSGEGFIWKPRRARHEYGVDDGVALLLVVRLSCAQRNATSVGGRCLLNACVSVNIRYLIDSVSAICSVKRLSHACRVQLQVKLRTAH